MKYFIFFILLIFISCSNEKGKIQESAKAEIDSLAEIAKYPKQIVGEWEAVSIKIDVKSDSAYQYYVASGQWEEKLGYKPFKTVFRTNNTYQMDYPNVNDSIIDSRRGIWNIFGDTLLMIENEATYQNIIRIKNNHIEYSTLVDWDDDGEIDDKFEQIDKKIVEKEQEKSTTKK